MAMRPAGRGDRRPPTTPSRPGVGVQPVYEGFRPMSEWMQDKESDILLIYLPGFSKQNLKVSTEGQNIVRARGERLDAGNKWSRFQEDYQVPERCDIRAVRARFEGGILTVTMPRRKDLIDQERSKEAVPPKTLSSPDTQKQPSIPPKELKEAMPQKGFENTPRKEQFKTPSEPKESIPEKGVDDIPPKVLSPPALISTTKEPKEPIPPKVFDDFASNARSQQPLLTAGSSGKGIKDEKTFNEPLSQKGQDEERDRLADPPKTSEKSLTGIKDNTVRKSDSSEMKGKSIKSDQNLRRSKEESGVDDDKRRSEKNSGLVDKRAENVAKKNGNDEKEKQATATSTARTDYGLRNYKQLAVRSLDVLNEERQLLVNVGAAVLVIVALGTYIITSTIGSGEAKQ